MKRLNIKLAVFVVAGFVILGLGVHFLHAFQVDRNAEGILEQAKSLYEKEDLDEALQFAGRYWNLRTGDLEGSRLLADIAFEAGEKKGATRRKKLYGIYEMERALRLDPDDAQRRRKLMDYYVKNGWITSAMDHVKLLRDPQKFDLKLEIIAAKCCAWTGAFDEAARICQTLVGYDPSNHTFRDNAPGRNDFEGYAILAELMHQKKLGTQAQTDAVIEKMVELNGESSKAHLAAHSYWRRTHKDEQAKQALARAIEIDPDSPDVALLAAEQAIDQQRLDDAEALLRAALKEHPEEASLYRLMAFIEQRRRRNDEAIKVLEGGIEKLPENESLLQNLVAVQLENRNVEQARVAYNKLKELGLIESAYDYYEGQFLMSDRKWKQAIDRLTQARSKMAHDPRMDAQIKTLIGKCYQMLGDPDKANEYFSGIANQASGLTEADLGLAQTLMATGRNPEALKQFEAIAAATAENEKMLEMPYVWRPLLQLRVWDQMRLAKEKRDWTKVEGLVKQLNQAGKLDPISHTTLQGELLVNKGETEAARTLYSTALHANPQSEALWVARLNLELEAGSPDQALRLAQQAPREIQDGVYLRLARAAIFARMEGDTAKAGLLAQERGIDQLKKEDRYRLLQGLAQHHKQLKDHESARRLLDQMMAEWDKDLFSRNMAFDIAREKGDIKTMEQMVSQIRKIMEPDSPYPPVFEAVTQITGVSAAQRAKLKPEDKRFELSSEEKKTLAAARGLLAKVAKDQPAWNEPHKWLAEIHALENNADGMLAELRIAMREGPLDSTRTRQLYDLLVSKGLNAEAEQVYAKLGGEKRGGTEWSQVNILIQGKRFEEARDLLDKMAPTADTPLEDLLRYADASRRINDLVKAEAALRQAVKLDSSSAHAWVMLVNTLVAARKQSEAEEVAESARTRVPAEDRELVLAQCYEALRDTNRAEKSYLNAVGEKPTSLLANQAIAGFYLRTNRTETAMKYLDAIAREGAAATSAADREIVDWALRGRAVALAANGNWQQFREAEALLSANEDKIRQNGGEPEPAHLLLRSALLSSRKEPSSKRAALKLLEELQSRQPLQNSELVNMAKLYEEVGQWSKAKEVMLGVLAGRIPDPMHFLGYAEMLWRNGEYNDADTWLDKYDRVRNDGSSVPIRVKVRVRQGREKEAVALLDRSLGSPPWHPSRLDLVRVSATLLHQLRQYADAARLWRGYIRGEPSGVIFLAASVGMNGDLDQAMTLLEESLKHHPPRDVLLIGMEVLRAHKTTAKPEHFSKLGRWYAEAIKSSPKDPQLEMLVGDMWEIRGDLNKAEQAYRKVLDRTDLDPMTRAHVGNNLAFILSTQRKDTDEAVELIDSAMEVYGPNSDLLDTRGVVYLAAGKPDKALADFREAVLVPSAMKWVHLAFAQSALKDQQGARASLKKAHEMDLKRQDLYDAEWTRYEQLARQFGML